MFVIAFRSGASMKGPFLTERAMLFRLPLHDELVGAFVVARLVAQFGLAPWRHGMVTLDASFTATVRVVHGIHHNAADRRPNSHMPDTSGLAQRHVLMVKISDLPYRRHAVDVDKTNFA